MECITRDLHLSYIDLEFGNFGEKLLSDLMMGLCFFFIPIIRYQPGGGLGRREGEGSITDAELECLYGCVLSSKGEAVLCVLSRRSSREYI
jgi:hypothetical protein